MPQAIPSTGRGGRIAAPMKFPSAPARISSPRPRLRCSIFLSGRGWVRGEISGAHTGFRRTRIVTNALRKCPSVHPAKAASRQGLPHAVQDASRSRWHLSRRCRLTSETGPMPRLNSTLVSHRGHRIHWPVVAVFRHPTPLDTSPNGTAHHSEGLPSLSEATLVKGTTRLGKQTQRLRHTPRPPAASAKRPAAFTSYRQLPNPVNLPK